MWNIIIIINIDTDSGFNIHYDVFNFDLLCWHFFSTHAIDLPCCNVSILLHFQLIMLFQSRGEGMRTKSSFAKQCICSLLDKFKNSVSLSFLLFFQKISLSLRSHSWFGSFLQTFYFFTDNFFKFELAFVIWLFSTDILFLDSALLTL